MYASASLASLLPPLVVLILGYLTHRIILSLIAGIVLAALIACWLDPIAATELIAKTIWHNLEFDTFFSKQDFWQTWNLFICIFLLMLGIFSTMLEKSGGAYAYGIFARRKIKNAKTAETSSLVLSTGLFVDDYLSCLTVGSVMNPLTDMQRIPRVKLAYLVDSMSAPLAILCPFSSWVAAIMGFLKENGISEQVTTKTLIVANPLTVFLNIMPYVFYSFILIASTWFLVRYRISFGLMKKHEDIARTTGNLFGGKQVKNINDSKEHNPQHTTLLEFFFPMFVLLICVLGGILYSGGWWVFGGNHGLIYACQNSSAAAGLFVGGTISTLICSTFFVLRDRIKIKELPQIFWQGIKLMISAVTVLMLAWSLGDLLREQLHTGQYLAQLMLNSVNIILLPMILFFTATVIAFTIGTSWGTAAMLFPIVIPLVLSMTNAPVHPHLEQIKILFPVLGAVLSGCVAGNHISPIADTTIMSCMSTGAKLKDHIITQLQYAIPGILVTGLAFLLSSYLLSYSSLASVLISLLAAISINALILLLLNKASN